MQDLAGVRQEAKSIEDAGFIRSSMPRQHSDFYESLPLLFVSTTDKTNAVWLSALCGAPGFTSSSSPKYIEIDLSSVNLNDKVNFSIGSYVGILGIEMHTRRRNRANGIVTKVNSKCVQIELHEVNGNCPKYIQTRKIVYSTAPIETESQVLRVGESLLDAGALSLVAKSDTFFLATTSQLPGTGIGNDASHRGGPIGFVNIHEENGVNVLSWADYSGNNMFMSLGNIAVNSSTGLLFIDWENGATLQITGHATIDFNDRSLPGAQRVVSLRVQAWRYIHKALSIHPAPLIEASPYNPQSHAAIRVECIAVRSESSDVKTFVFKAPEHFTYESGQYATFEFNNSSNHLTRTWTISSPIHTLRDTGTFEISVKRAGLVSEYLHNEMSSGGVLHLRGIGGTFVPRVTSASQRVVLLAGGIGITPFRSMLPVFLHHGVEVTLVYSVKQVKDAAYIHELSHVSSVSPLFRLILVSSSLDSASNAGCELVRGRISSSVIGHAIRSGRSELTRLEAYVCGPPAYMSACEAALLTLGLTQADIHSESFDF